MHNPIIRRTSSPDNRRQPFLTDDETTAFIGVVCIVTVLLIFLSIALGARLPLLGFTLDSPSSAPARTQPVDDVPFTAPSSGNVLISPGVWTSLTTTIQTAPGDRALAAWTQSPGAARQPAALGFSAYLTTSDITDDAWIASS